MALTRETLERVAQIIRKQAEAVRDCEIQKEVLCQQKDFVALNVFNRIDSDGKCGIDSLDLVSYFRDNGLVVSEADCYMLVKTFNSKGDGRLSLIE